MNKEATVIENPPTNVSKSGTLSSLQHSTSFTQNMNVIVSCKKLKYFCFKYQTLEYNRIKYNLFHLLF